ncbi:RNA polymerase sigma-54 factor [Lysinibacillus sp. PLM2]|nr:RNA polymerase sigma-54 factor [Lysinibacillus sp. PLM2]
MALSMNLQQKLETKFILNQQQKFSLEILKYSMQELVDYIHDEVNSNPILEAEGPLYEEKQLIEFARLDRNQNAKSEAIEHEQFDSINLLRSTEQSLEKYLTGQLSMVKNLTLLDRKIILFYIHSLNSNGYLECDLNEVAEMYTVPISKCEELLTILHGFEPYGVGARNLKECLLLQIKHQKNAPKLAEVFVQLHLEELADRRFLHISELYQIPEETVKNIFSYIQQLNPFPANEFDTGQTEHIIPDIIVEELHGEYIIRINESYLPQISINTYYDELMKTNEDVKGYLKGKLSDALLLLKGIEQRHETLYKVTKILLEKQQAIFKNGLKALQPLRLKDVAEQMDVHESTVSRAISKKYIQTPKGIFPLKMLLMRGLKMNNGSMESTILIKEKIKSMIENENVKKPYSDQKIANILLAEGIQIARRTVAKYREEMGILQSTKRIKR